MLRHLTIGKQLPRSLLFGISILCNIYIYIILFFSYSEGKSILRSLKHIVNRRFYETSKISIIVIRICTRWLLQAVFLLWLIPQTGTKVHCLCHLVVLLISIFFHWRGQEQKSNLKTDQKQIKHPVLTWQRRRFLSKQFSHFNVR